MSKSILRNAIDFSKGYHDYIPHYFSFNDDTGEFTLVSIGPGIF